MKKVVFCLANSAEHADRIVMALQNKNFRNEDISVLFADREGRLSRNLRPATPYEDLPKTKRGTLGTEKHTKAPEGGVIGATTGGILGGSLGLLAGIGSLAIPGFGPFIAAGPIIAALSGSAVGGALGLLVGSLVGLGIPEFEAKKYENSLKAGHVLIAVHVDSHQECDRVKEILSQQGATDIVTSREKAGTR
jgi:uncharacterized membrane protein